MGSPEPDIPLGNPSSSSSSSASSPSSSPSSPSDGPTLFEDQDNSDHPQPLSSQEASLLQQEYDFQRRLISHYNLTRSTVSGNPEGDLQWRVEQEHLDHLGGQHTKAPKSKQDMRRHFIPQPHIYTSMENEGMYEKGYSHDAYAYPNTQPRRPLIDLVSNQWRSTASNVSHSPDSLNGPSFTRILSAPKFRRYLILTFILLLMPWGSWRWWGKRRWQEHRLLSDAFDEKTKTGKGWFGSNMRPTFAAMTQVETLNKELLPQAGDNKRLIVIGDVHGCYDECMYHSIYAA